MIVLLVVAVLLAGVVVGALVERWRWIHSPAVRAWTELTGEKVRLL